MVSAFAPPVLSLALLALVLAAAISGLVILLGRHRALGLIRAGDLLATALMLPFIAAPVALGVMLHDQPREAALAVGALFALFWATYVLGMQWAKRRSRRAPRPAVLAVR